MNEEIVKCVFHSHRLRAVHIYGVLVLPTHTLYTYMIKALRSYLIHNLFQFGEWQRKQSLRNPLIIYSDIFLFGFWSVVFVCETDIWKSENGEGKTWIFLYACMTMRHKLYAVFFLSCRFVCFICFFLHFFSAEHDSNWMSQMEKKKRK